jgi:hypothetical protein
LSERLVTARRRTEQRVDVECSVCGTLFETGDRQSRRLRTGEKVALCSLCWYLEKHPLCDDDRRWWLERFNDEQIVQLASGLFGFGSVEAVAAWRIRLGLSTSSHARWSASA